MVRRLLICGALTLLLSWGATARAGDDASCSKPGCADNAQKKHAHPVLDWVRSFPVAYTWSNHNEYLSTNVRSEVVFLFGSARDFYGEPTVKGPPIPAYPVYPSYQFSPGYPGCRGYENSPEYPFRANPAKPISATFYPAYTPYPPGQVYPKNDK